MRPDQRRALTPPPRGVFAVLRLLPRSPPPGSLPPRYAELRRGPTRVRIGTVHADHPFAASYTSRLLYLTVASRDCLARLDHALGAREPILLVTGPAGTGKTTLVLAAAERWG